MRARRAVQFATRAPTASVASLWVEDTLTNCRSTAVVLRLLKTYLDDLAGKFSRANVPRTNLRVIASARSGRSAIRRLGPTQALAAPEMAVVTVRAFALGHRWRWGLQRTKRRVVTVQVKSKYETKRNVQ